jgi:hypothetical protein
MDGWMHDQGIPDLVGYRLEFDFEFTSVSLEKFLVDPCAAMSRRREQALLGDRDPASVLTDDDLESEESVDHERFSSSRSSSSSMRLKACRAMRHRKPPRAKKPNETAAIAHEDKDITWQPL